MKLRVQSSQPTDSAHDLNVDGVTGDLQRLNLGSKTQQASLFLQLFGQFMQDTFGQEALSLLEDRMDQFATDESSVDDEELTLTPRTSIAEAEEGKVHSEDKGKDCVFFGESDPRICEGSRTDSVRIRPSRSLELRKHGRLHFDNVLCTNYSRIAPSHQMA